MGLNQRIFLKSKKLFFLLSLLLINSCSKKNDLSLRETQQIILSEAALVPFNKKYGYVVSGLTGAAGALGTNQNDIASSIQIDIQGRLVIAGSSKDISGNYQMVIWRYHTDGTLDTSFNANGTGVNGTGAPGTVISGPTSGVIGANPGIAAFNTGYKVQIDSNQRILVAGQTNKYNSGSGLAIWRYNSDGSLDTTFNANGTNPGVALFGAVGATGHNGTGFPMQDGINKMRIDSSGRIVVVGYSKTGIVSSGANNFKMVIWRYKSNGTLDTTFNALGTGANGNGMPGYAISNNPGGSITFNDWGYDFQFDALNRILIVGRTGRAIASYPPGYTTMIVWRYNSDGTLDTTFNAEGTLDVLTSGTVSTPGTGKNGYFFPSFGPAGASISINERAAGHGIKIDTNGKLLIMGLGRTTTSNMELVCWRYNSDGTPDTTFNAQGTGVNNYGLPGYVLSGPNGLSVSTLNVPREYSRNSITPLIDSKGRIIISGYSINSANGAETFIIRYNSNGVLDKTYNASGTGPLGTGNSGIVLTGPLGASGTTDNNVDDNAFDMILDSAERLVLVGFSKASSTPNHTKMAIWRYKSDGTIDK